MCSREAKKERDPTLRVTRSGHMHIHGGGGLLIELLLKWKERILSMKFVL